MTATTENLAGTALAQQVAPGALARLQDAKPWTVADLADIIAAPARQVSEDEALPQPAAPVNFTDKLRAALRKLPQVFGSVQPTERRRLEEAEIVRMTDEYNAIETVKAQMAKRQEAIKEAMRIHQDFLAADAGRTSIRIADGVARGHYLAATPGEPFEVAVAGYEDSWSQRYVKGGTSQSLTLLTELLDTEEISREEFNAFTHAVRELDEAKIAAYIRKNPKRGLQILTAITRRSAPGASLYAPKK
jgi:hypothetical protein